MYLLRFAFALPLKKPEQHLTHMKPDYTWEGESGAAVCFNQRAQNRAVPQRWVQWRGGAARCLRVSPDDTSLLSDANLPLTGNKKNLGKVLWLFVQTCVSMLFALFSLDIGLTNRLNIVVPEG